MDHKFNHFTGRLSAPSPLDTPSKFGQAAEGPSIQYMQGTKLNVTDHPKGGSRFAQVPGYLQQKMRSFQFPNSLPVHVKGGPVDKILYGVTAAVCLAGLLESCRVYYVLSYPQTKDE